MSPFSVAFSVYEAKLDPEQKEQVKKCCLHLLENLYLNNLPKTENGNRPKKAN